MENILIAIIETIKEIIVALIGILKKEKTDDSDKNIVESDKDKPCDEPSNNPFIPTEKKITNLDINDPKYLLEIGEYLYLDRPPEDVYMEDGKNEF